MQTNSPRITSYSDPAKKGVFFVGDKKVFWKVVDKQILDHELAGYESVSKYYPVPKLYGYLSLSGDQYALCFEYDETVKENAGLLVDMFATEDTLTSRFSSILQMYRNVFLKTLSYDRPTAGDVFFASRVQERIPKYYTSDFLGTTHDFVFNGRLISMQLGSTVDQVREFFSHTTDSWCVVSQCDPNDLNMGTRPVLFDYTAGGYVPLMAEFATLFWYQLAQGSYLAPKYNEKAFIEHNLIYNKMDEVSFMPGCVTHTPNKLRLLFLHEYVKQVIKPCLERMPKDTNWFLEFKNYLAMKILGVFNVAKMERQDMLLSLGYLHLLYTAEVTSIEDLFSHIERV